MMAFEVWIGGRAHEVKIAVPEGGGEELRRSVLRFALSTACLEQAGVLPKGIPNAVV